MPLFFNIAALAAVSLLSWVYIIGLENSYFWIYSWYDMLLHAIGGITIGLWGSAVAARARFAPKEALWFILCVTLAVVVAWETWEYVVGLTRELPDYWSDTLQDIAIGMVGATAAWVLYIVLRRA